MLPDKMPPRRIHAAIGDDAPSARRHAPLLLVPSGSTLKFVCLNEFVTKVALHYLRGENSVEWCDESPSCPLCLRGNRMRYSRYVAIAALPGCSQHTLAIPPQAWLYAEALQKFNGCLRGIAFTAKRLRNGGQGPVRIERLDQTIDPKKLPSGWDVLEKLAESWGLSAPGDAFEGGK